MNPAAGLCLAVLLQLRKKQEKRMNRFTGFVIKEFYHIFMDYRTLLILFGMPAVQLLLFGYVITN